MVGGDVVSPRHFLRAIDHLPKCALINGYGPTESTVFAICYLASRESATHQQIPIGFPIANTQAFILDRDLKPVSIDAIGELYLGGDGLARGYLNRPELTAETFIAIPGNGARLYRTGDLARFRSDGAIEFLGRVDAQRQISGYRVEPGEIVFAIRQHPDVRDAAVVCKSMHDPGVDAERRLIAYVVGPRALDPLALARFSGDAFALLHDSGVVSSCSKRYRLPSTASSTSPAAKSGQRPRARAGNRAQNRPARISRKYRALLGQSSATERNRPR